MPLTAHFKHLQPTPIPEAPTEPIDYLGMVEASQGASEAQESLERALEQLDTRMVYEALCLESHTLSEEALKWKQFTESLLDDTPSLEADDDKPSLWSRMIDAIKRFFAKIRDAFKAFWGKVNKAAPQLVKEAEKLKKQASKLRRDPTNTQFDSGLFGLLGKNNKGTDGRALLQDLKTAKTISVEILSKDTSYTKIAGDYEKTLSEITKSVPDIKTNPVADQVRSLTEAFSYKTLATKDTTIDITLGGFKQAQVLRSEVLPGGTALATAVPNPMAVRSYLTTKSNPQILKDNDRFTDIIKGFHGLTLSKVDKHDNQAEGSVPTLKPKEIEDLCDQVIAMVEVFTPFEKDADARVKALDKIGKDTDTLQETLNKKGDNLEPFQKAVLKDTIGFNKALTFAMLSFPQMWSLLSISIVKDTLTYCRESINQYSS